MNVRPPRSISRCFFHSEQVRIRLFAQVSPGDLQILPRSIFTGRSHAGLRVSLTRSVFLMNGLKPCCVFFPYRLDRTRLSIYMMRFMPIQLWGSSNAFRFLADSASFIICASHFCFPPSFLQAYCFVRFPFLRMSFSCTSLLFDNPAGFLSTYSVGRDAPENSFRVRKWPMTTLPLRGYRVDGKLMPDLPIDHFCMDCNSHLKWSKCS